MGENRFISEIKWNKDKKIDKLCLNAVRFKVKKMPKGRK